MSSTATVTINSYPRGIDNTQRNEIVRGTIALSSGTYPGGGYALSFASEQVKVLPGYLPVDMDVKSVGTASPPTGPSGYLYFWDNVVGNLHVFVTSTSPPTGPLVELTTGAAVPAAVVADTIMFTATFTRN